jgi:hypothetical protein
VISRLDRSRDRREPIEVRVQEQVRGRLQVHRLPLPGRHDGSSQLVAIWVRWYLGIMVEIVRVQTGVRVERTILKVLKGLAEYLDMSLGDLLEGIALHTFEGKAPFGPQTLEKITQLREVYGLTLTAQDSHRLTE